MLAGLVWHYWIGVVMFVGTIATVLGVVAMYFFMVERKRYPTRRHNPDYED
jgi:formate-dependent nitrite reductase membrane component NrfD